MSTIIELQPKKVWYFFDQINQLPRASKKEEKVQSYLQEFAKENNLEYRKDNAGNILIKKKAASAYSSKPIIILQTHMDMVCEKNSDSKHNFDTDPIQTYIDGDWVKAKETTLGADNGIGMAMQLALLSSDIDLPTLECLFTTDEETGLYGATNLDPHLLSGKTLINLDTEEEGEFCIGCAGGMDTLISISYSKEVPNEKLFYFTVKISGLQGGHSGEDINKGRANAVKILAEYMSIIQKKSNVHIAEINGGNLRNAIAREANAILAVPYSDKELVRIELNLFIAEIEEIYKETEKSIRLELGSCTAENKTLPKELSSKLIDSLNNCPHGVIEMNEKIPGLVESSTNLAAIHTLENLIFVETSQRSAVENKKREIAESVGKAFKEIASKIEKGKDYPGWEPNMNSNILNICKGAYSDLFQKEAIIKVIHAGLECGVISKKYPELDMISIGPTIINPHSPYEMVEISSVQKSWDLLLKILKSV